MTEMTPAQMAAMGKQMHQEMAKQMAAKQMPIPSQMPDKPIPKQ